MYTFTQFIINFNWNIKSFLISLMYNVYIDFRYSFLWLYLNGNYFYQPYPYTNTILYLPFSQLCWYNSSIIWLLYMKSYTINGVVTQQKLNWIFITIRVNMPSFWQWLIDTWIIRLCLLQKDIPIKFALYSANKNEEIFNLLFDVV